MLSTASLSISDMIFVFFPQAFVIHSPSASELLWVAINIQTVILNLTSNIEPHFDL